MIDADLSRCVKPSAIGPALLMYLRRGFDVTIKRWTCPVFPLPKRAQFEVKYKKRVAGEFPRPFALFRGAGSSHKALFLLAGPGFALVG